LKQKNPDSIENDTYRRYIIKNQKLYSPLLVVDDVFVKTTSDRAVMGIFGHLSEFID
jgi:hypothetical protein